MSTSVNDISSHKLAVLRSADVTWLLSLGRSCGICWKNNGVEPHTLCNWRGALSNGEGFCSTSDGTSSKDASRDEAPGAGVIGDGGAKCSLSMSEGEGTGVGESVGVVRVLKEKGVPRSTAMGVDGNANVGVDGGVVGVRGVEMISGGVRGEVVVFGVGSARPEMSGV